MTHPSGYAPLLHNLQPDLLHRGNKAARQRHQRLASIAFLKHRIGTREQRQACGYAWVRQAIGQIRGLEREDGEAT